MHPAIASEGDRMEHKLTSVHVVDRPPDGGLQWGGKNPRRLWHRGLGSSSLGMSFPIHYFVSYFSEERRISFGCQQ